MGAWLCKKLKTEKAWHHSESYNRSLVSGIQFRKKIAKIKIKGSFDPYSSPVRSGPCR